VFRELRFFILGGKLGHAARTAHKPIVVRYLNAKIRNYRREVAVCCVKAFLICDHSVLLHVWTSAKHTGFRDLCQSVPQMENT